MTMPKRNDKLLLMGCSFGTQDALNYAKSQGIYTIVTDHLPPEQQPLKLQADAYWMCDVKDLDTLEQNCRRAGVTGIFGGTSEFCLDYTKALCKRLGLSFYASEEGWAASRDKELFKQHCSACGLDVPRQYEISADGPLPADLRWPVIVKPVDACASMGISVCRNADELRKGYTFAQSHSASGRVIVEDFMEGDEVHALYLLQEGHAELVSFLDISYIEIEGRNVPAYGDFQSKYQAEYEKEAGHKVLRLLKAMDCVNGAVFFQMIRQNGRYYFIEMGYRLNAGASWRVEEKLKGTNSLQSMVDLAVGRHPLRSCEPDQVLYPCGGMYFLWSRPGRVASIRGLDEVRAMDGLEIVLQNFKAGDQIPQEISMRQVVFKIAVFGQTEEVIRCKIERINATLHMYDTAGHEMLHYVTALK